jgi:hypothetical protein
MAPYIEDNTPSMDNTRFFHGRVDPGLESSLGLVDAVEVKESVKEAERFLWNDSKEPANLQMDITLSMFDAPISGPHARTPASPFRVSSITSF